VRSALATAEQAAQALQDADLELRKVEPAERSPARRRRAEAASIYARLASPLS
jgi:LuxR family transcriptional regulator, regulator of acetate metabolism